MAKTNPEKTRAVLDWPQPTTRRQLQNFLGFANFYCRFIKGYSLIAAPFRRLTSLKTSFIWTPNTDKAFSKLKDLFTSPPVLTQPDPRAQFVVEVDASDVGVGAVLSR